MSCDLRPAPKYARGIVTESIHGSPRSLDAVMPSAPQGCRAASPGRSETPRACAMWLLMLHVQKAQWIGSKSPAPHLVVIVSPANCARPQHLWQVLFTEVKT